MLGTVLAHAAISARAVDVIKAQQLGERAVEFTRQLDDDRALVESLAALCGAYYFAGEPERGLALGEESVERARRIGDDGLLAGSLLGYLLCADRIEPDRTERLFAEAIACAQRSGDLLMSCFAHNNAGVHALRAGDFPGARAHLEQADAAMRATGSPGHQVSVNLGWVLHQEGDLQGALASFEAGLRVGRRLGDRPASPTRLSAWRASPRIWATPAGRRPTCRNSSKRRKAISPTPFVAAIISAPASCSTARCRSLSAS